MSPPDALQPLFYGMNRDGILSRTFKVVSEYVQIGASAVSLFAFLILPSSAPVFFCNLLRVKIRSSLGKMLTSHLVVFGLFGSFIPFVLTFVL